MVFDKTGTLTYGRPEVNCVITTVPEITLSLQAFFAVIGLAESSSEHPLGVAICNFARQVRCSSTATMLSHYFIECVWCCRVVLLTV